SRGSTSDPRAWGSASRTTCSSRPMGIACSRAVFRRTSTKSNGSSRAESSEPQARRAARQSALLGVNPRRREAMKTICVFCGSHSGKRPAYVEAARRLGWKLAESSIDLVYGGGSIGLMGTLANAVLDRNGRAIGVIPDWLSNAEVMHEGLTELHVVS